VTANVGVTGTRRVGAGPSLKHGRVAWQCPGASGVAGQPTADDAAAAAVGVSALLLQSATVSQCASITYNRRATPQRARALP